MTLTADQKRALYIFGGVAAVAVLVYMYRSNSAIPPTATGVPDAPTFQNSPPGYTTFNVQPLTLPPSISSSPSAPMIGQGCGCTDQGCFTSSSIDTGRGPLNLDQLLSTYAQANKDIASLFAATVKPYQAPPATIPEMTQPNYAAWDLSQSAATRAHAFFSQGGFFNAANYPQYWANNPLV